MDQIILELDFHFDSFLRWLECGNQTRPACQLFEFEEVTVTCRRTTPSFCRFVLGVSENVWTSGIVYWTFGGDLMISQKSEHICIFPSFPTRYSHHFLMDFHHQRIFVPRLPIFSNADRSDGPGDTCREVIIPLGEATCSQSSAKEC